MENLIVVVCMGCDLCWLGNTYGPGDPTDDVTYQPPHGGETRHTFVCNACYEDKGNE